MPAAAVLAASEVEAALERIVAFDETWSCPECRTRVWHRGTPEAARCKCGQSAFPARSRLTDRDERRLVATELVIGRRLGHYVIVSQLGRGGMGDVYVAHDTRLDRRVALKLPRPEVSASVDRLALFQREARAVAALNHPNIVHLYSVEEADGLIFMTMELVQGRSLRELLSAGTPLALPRWSPSRLRSPRASRAAHAAGVLHRDLKPGKHHDH